MSPRRKVTPKTSMACEVNTSKCKPRVVAPPFATVPSLNMGGCRCTFQQCRSATKNTSNLHFFHYPVKHPKRCSIWIRNAGKPSYVNLPEEQLRNKVICSLHFEDRYFTNSNRKRLVHDALPTLDGGNQQPLTLTKDVQVLPSGNDGSTFTLQSQHIIQPGTSSSDVNDSGDSMDVEQEVFTIDPSYIEHLNRSEKDIFLHTDNNDSILYKLKKEVEDNSRGYENSDCESAISTSCTMQSQSNLIIDEDNFGSNTQNSYYNTKNGSERSVTTTTTTTSSKKRRFVAERSVLKRLNMHTQEIASIKRSLSVKHHFPRKRILQMLKGRIPDTLLGALSLQLFKTEKDLGDEETAFLHAIHSIAPSTYKQLQDIGWFIPNHVIVDQTET